MSSSRGADPVVPRLKVAMLVYPGLTLLDLAGPEAALAPHADIYLAWKRREVVPSDGSVGIQATVTFADCPRDLDILFVPGGLGTADVLEDQEVLGFLRSRAATARYVTSVCSGSLILAAAGLMDGYRCTTHWSALDLLPLFGARVVKERVVRDRNRLSGGGVTAGIDFGLTLLAETRGEPVARMTQLMLEYDPQPPFNAGSPESAGPEMAAMAMAVVREVNDRTRMIGERRRGILDTNSRSHRW